MFKDKPLFTVFGGAYVHEHHNDAGGIDFESAAAQGRADAGAAWLVAATLLVGLTICAAEITFFAGRGSGLL